MRTARGQTRPTGAAAAGRHPRPGRQGSQTTTMGMPETLPRPTRPASRRRFGCCRRRPWTKTRPTIHRNIVAQPSSRHHSATHPPIQCSRAAETSPAVAAARPGSRVIVRRPAWASAGQALPPPQQQKRQVLTSTQLSPGHEAVLVLAPVPAARPAMCTPACFACTRCRRAFPRCTSSCGAGR